MDSLVSNIKNLIGDNGPGFLFLACCMLVTMLGGPAFFRAQKYLLGRHQPEGEAPTSFQRWWSGLMLSSSVALQLLALGIFFLPILAGLIAILALEVYFMLHTDTALWTLPPQSDGMLILAAGMLLIAAGIYKRKEKIPFLIRTSGLFYYLNRMESVAMVFLAGTGLVFTLVSIFFIRPFPVSSVILCVPVSIAAGVVLSWLMEDTDIPGRHPYDPEPKAGFDRSFRLSKIKDPSQKDDPNWWKQEKVDRPVKKNDPPLRFSKLKESEAEDKKRNLES